MQFRVSQSPMGIPGGTRLLRLRGAEVITPPLTCFDNNGAISGSLVGTPFVDPAVPLCKPSVTTPPSTYAETTGGVTHTWTDYSDAGGTEGPNIGSNVTVQITCALLASRSPMGIPGGTILSLPWNNVYYASADAFYNNGQTSGTLKGTPFVDPAVPICPQQSSPAPVRRRQPEV